MPDPCPHHLGRLACLRRDPHPGNGRGCVHHASDAPDRRHDDEITQETAS